MKPRLKFPFDGKYPVTFKFGEKPNWYVLKTGYPHNGVDFALPIGTPVFATDHGKITYADNMPDSDGLGINIGHKWGMSQYWHLQKLIAKGEQNVKKGDVIGISGVTGWATGPHLHFGIKVHDDSPQGMRGWTDPLRYLMGSQPTLPKPPPITKIHRVKIGDSLWKIANKYYGRGWYWPQIYAANRDKIKDPALIFPFQKLIIP